MTVTDLALESVAAETVELLYETYFQAEQLTGYVNLQLTLLAENQLTPCCFSRQITALRVVVALCFEIKELAVELLPHCL